MAHIVPGIASGIDNIFFDVTFTELFAVHLAGSTTFPPSWLQKLLVFALFSSQDL